MKYFYKYIKIMYIEGKYIAYYRDDFNYFTICDKYGVEVCENTRNEAMIKARKIIDDLNGKREV